MLALARPTMPIWFAATAFSSRDHNSAKPYWLGSTCRPGGPSGWSARAALTDNSVTTASAASNRNKIRYRSVIAVFSSIQSPLTTSR